MTQPRKFTPPQRRLIEKLERMQAAHKSLKIHEGVIWYITWINDRGTFRSDTLDSRVCNALKRAHVLVPVDESGSEYILMKGAVVTTKTETQEQTTPEGQDILIIPRGDSGLQEVVSDPGHPTDYVHIGHNDVMIVDRFQSGRYQSSGGNEYVQLVLFSKNERRRVAVQMTWEDWVIAVGKLFDQKRRGEEREEAMRNLTP
jgi:hypothetical protein